MNSNVDTKQAELLSFINHHHLEKWMDEQGLGSGPILNSEILSGGTQNILMSFSRNDRSYILRRPPPHPRPNSNKTMGRESRMLAALGTSKVPHPKLIAACNDELILGCTFYLMELVAGFNPTTGMPDFHAQDANIRHEMGLNMAEGIATLASIDYLSVGLEDFGKPEGFLKRQVPRWQSQLASYQEFTSWPGPSAIKGLDTVSKWLVESCPKSFQPGILHGDYHLANVMFELDSPKLAAIVDWELTTIGDPLLDLGWLMATWPDENPILGSSVEPWDGFPCIEELIEHYAKFSNRDMSNINWYGVLACFKLGIILEGTYARASEGKAPQETGERLHASTLALFERALRLIG